MAAQTIYSDGGSSNPCCAKTVGKSILRKSGENGEKKGLKK